MSRITYKTTACYLEVSNDELNAILNLESRIGGLNVFDHGPNDDSFLKEYIIDLTEVHDWYKDGVDGEPAYLNAAYDAIENALDPDRKHNLRQYGIIILYCEV